MSTLTHYAGCSLKFTGTDSRMITGKKYNIIKDTICFDAEGDKYWRDFGDYEEPKETRYLTVVDERNNIRDFEVINFK